ncbi:MAG: N-acyl homoserine lactonase family protein [Candidatus Limnocylindria bacterium]
MSATPSLRLYVLDGGLIRDYDASDLADDGAYNGRLLDLPAPCFLIRHPDGDLIWESGISQTRTDLEIGVEFAATLEEQLAILGLARSEIRFVSVSHGHWDHSGNAGLFASSTWIVNRAERAAMFDDESRASQAMDDYGALEAADTVLISDDHDVFGDGSVRIIQSPGHTPGHTVLLVRLADAGPILLSGDLWHLAESRIHRRVPPFNIDRAQTLASMDKVEALVAATGARVVIQHESADIAALPRFPGYLA